MFDFSIQDNGYFGWNSASLLWEDFLPIASGESKVRITQKLIEDAQEKGATVVGFLDDKIYALAGFAGCPAILGSVEDWGVGADVQYVCAVGDSWMRVKCAALIEGKGGVFTSIVHPTAYMGPSVKMGAGCVVFPFAVEDCDLATDRHVIANVHSLVAHDCVLQDCATHFSYCAYWRSDCVSS